MALYVFICDKCGISKRRLIAKVEEANAGISCKAVGCIGTLRRTPTPPSLHNKEVLRLGHQIRDIERFDDAERLYDERAHMDPRKPE